MFSFALPGRAQAPDAGPRRPRPARARASTPSSAATRTRTTSASTAGSSSATSRRTPSPTPSTTSATSTSTPGCRCRWSPPRSSTALLGSVLDPRRRLVQHHPRARLRLLHPQGVGVAQPPRRVHPQPRGVPRLAGNRRDAGGRAALACRWSGPSSTCGSRSGEVVLRGVTDADLEPLLAVLPDDLEHDPGHQRVPRASAADRRRRWSPRSGSTAAPGRPGPGASTSPSRSTAAWSACRRWRARSSRCCAPSTRSPGWPPTCAAAAWPP